MKLPLTVVIPTLNEAIHIERCLHSVKDAHARFVVDAFSNDNTREIAAARGANVVTHAWTGYSAQKNWALDELPIETEWVLFLDADESVSAELLVAIGKVIFSPDAADGYFVNRQLVFMGKTLRHAWWYPDRVLRIFRHRLGRFDDHTVHERVRLNGRTGILDEDLIHENRKSLSAFIERHNRYSSLEAAQIVSALRSSANAVRPHFRGDPAQRRRALKEKVWWRLPLLVRPVVRFVWMFVIRRGFLDGMEGLVYSLLIASYELQIDTKIMELRRSGGATVPE